MDYLLLLGARRPSFPGRGISESGAWPAFEVVPVAGGELGFTATKYHGFVPTFDDQGVTLVACDPLFDWVRASDRPAGRTEQVAARLIGASLAAAHFEPFHAGTVVRCVAPVEAPSGLIAELRGDALGGAPVFMARGRGFVAISSSPDLIALATGGRLDVLAARELVSQGKVTFPYTLYAGVHEVTSGIVLRVSLGRSGLRVAQVKPAPPSVAHRIAPVADASEASGFVSELMDEFFRRMSVNLGSDQPIGCTLSAGYDSRAILASAVRIVPGEVTAITGSPDENPELWTAREVAARLGVRQETAIWDPAPIVDRFRSGSGLLLGTHRRWTDANFVGASRIFDQRVVLGGYMSGALMDGQDGQLTLRLARIADGSIPADSHWSVIAKSFLQLDARSQRRIIRRTEAARRALDPRYRTVSHLRYSIPATRGIYPAHWIGLAHEWAQYEPFLTEGGFAIAVACEPLGGPGRKATLFAATLEAAGLAGIPVNPESAVHGRSRPWLPVTDVLADDPEFALPYRRMSSHAREILGIEWSAVRLKNLLVNVYWADRLLTRWAPVTDTRRLRGLRAAARRLLRRRAR